MSVPLFIEESGHVQRDMQHFLDNINAARSNLAYRASPRTGVAHLPINTL